MLAGAVEGYVVDIHGNNVTDAVVYVISPYNWSIVYYNATVDSTGHYHFPRVSTSNPGSRTYKIKAVSDAAGTGYSDDFDVSFGNTTYTSVTALRYPAKITLTAERDYVVSNYSDHILIDAHVTDSTGAPSYDGIPILFTVDAPQWSYHNGSFGSNNSQRVVANITGGNGHATASFGWVPAGQADGTVKINATIPAEILANSTITLKIIRAVPATPSPSTSTVATGTVMPSSATAMPGASVADALPPTVSVSLNSTPGNVSGTRQALEARSLCCGSIALPLLAIGLLAIGDIRKKKRGK